MSFIQSMKERYTVKLYDNTKKINDQQIEELKEVLQLSPSSINSQPWKFSFVRDAETKAKLAAASFFNKEKIEDCDTLVVFNAIDDVAFFEKQINDNLPEGAVGYYNGFLKPEGEHYIKNWMQKQVYLSLGFFLSACAEMNIDSTPMEGIEPEKYNAILNKDGKYTTLFAVAIGYKSENDGNQPSKTPKSRLKLEEVLEII